jgi:hypothetical protein
MTSWKIINCSRTMLHGVSFWPKSGHGNSVVLYPRRSLCPPSEIHNARTIIYSRGGQRADLRAPQFKCNYGISNALNRTFFYLPASFFCSSTLVSYEPPFFRGYFKIPFNVSLMHLQTTRMLFFKGNSCERHQWRAPATLCLPLVYSLSRESVLYVGVQPCMPHPQSTMVFINNCHRENRGTYCNYHLKNRITAGYKKQNKNAIHMPMHL